MNEGKKLTSMEESSTPEPVLLAVDDDPNTLGRIEHELRQRYGSYYRVACEASPEAGMRTLQDLRAADKEVTVVLADQWMPGMTGVEFLTHTRQLYPGAKRALLFERGNRTTREPILQAMALGQVDSYVPKPERPPDEEFHSEITHFLEDWAKDYRPASVAVRIVGEPWSARCYEMRDLLSRSGVPHALTSADSAPAAALFVLIGARPHTGWLPEEVMRDDRGYVITGSDLLRDGSPPEGWPLERPPMLMETSVPGVFAAGDVRCGSVKRVASAVGEGSIAIQMVHKYLT